MLGWTPAYFPRPFFSFSRVDLELVTIPLQQLHVSAWWKRREEVSREKYSHFWRVPMSLESMYDVELP